MTEQYGKDKYLKCSSCKCKYLNEEEHIKTDFGYNRLNERFKCCVKCRNRNMNTQTVKGAFKPDNNTTTIKADNTISKK